jgi:hypothetical protein
MRCTPRSGPRSASLIKCVREYIPGPAIGLEPALEPALGLGLEPALGLELGLEHGLGLEPALGLGHGLGLGLEPALGLEPVSQTPDKNTPIVLKRKQVETPDSKGQSSEPRVSNRQRIMPIRPIQTHKQVELMPKHTELTPEEALKWFLSEGNKNLTWQIGPDSFAYHEKHTEYSPLRYPFSKAVINHGLFSNVIASQENNGLRIPTWTHTVHILDDDRTFSAEYAPCAKEAIKKPVLVDAVIKGRPCETTPTQYYCALCKKYFTTLGAQQKHKDIMHPSDIMHEFRCHYCRYTTGWKAAMVMHVKSHENKREYKCPECPYAANNSSTLRQHKESKHSNGKGRFVCDICSLQCSRKDGLIRHKRLMHLHPSS